MTHFAILGGGRLARHMSHYFSLLHLPYSGWTRDATSLLNSHAIANPVARLRAAVQPASHVLLLVTDAAIAKLLKRYPFLQEKTLLHCSGALSLPGIAGAHPLMTFSQDLYTLEQYQRIPFMVDSGHLFSTLLPGLPNPYFDIGLEDKPRYHALCVMAGNFSQLLWQATSDRFDRMGLPSATLEPFLQQSLQNFLQHPGTALTGPFSRGDQETIQRNLNSLTGDPLQAVYRAFIELHQSNLPAELLQEAAS